MDSSLIGDDEDPAADDVARPLLPCGRRGADELMDVCASWAEGGGGNEPDVDANAALLDPLSLPSVALTPVLDCQKARAEG